MENINLKEIPENEFLVLFLILMNNKKVKELNFNCYKNSSKIANSTGTRNQTNIYSLYRAKRSY